MLTVMRRWLSIGLMFLVTVWLHPDLAHGETPLPDCLSYDADGRCLKWAVKLEVSVLQSSRKWENADSPSAIRSRSSAPRQPPRVCYHDGVIVPCNTGLGSWNSRSNTWCRRLPVQPSLSDPVWAGRTDGAIYECTRTMFDGIPDPSATVLVWRADGSTPDAPPPPDPEQMAYDLLARLNLEAPRLGIFPKPVEENPGSVTLVGWNMWLWVDSPNASTWGPISDTASQSGYSISLSAAVDRIEWDMGNGDKVTCDLGTPWQRDKTSNQPSPTCGYQYSTMGIYTITGTAHWSVHWSGIGQSGTISLPLSRTATIKVAEYQVLRVTDN